MKILKMLVAMFDGESKDSSSYILKALADSSRWDREYNIGGWIYTDKISGVELRSIDRGSGNTVYWKDQQLPHEVVLAVANLNRMFYYKAASEEAQREQDVLKSLNKLMEGQ